MEKKGLRRENKKRAKLEEKGIRRRRGKSDKKKTIREMESQIIEQPMWQLCLHAENLVLR